MSMYISTNLMSLSAQRSLSEAQKAQETAMERLSSGSRINSASDDAAGLAIAEGFTAQINGLNQAVKNGEQAASLANTAEGALSEVSDILQRMRELTVQASNSTLDTQNRAAIKSELTSLTAEIDRISQDTQYNGQKLLSGSAKNLQFQIGANAESKIDFSIESATAASLGVGAGSAGGAQEGIMFDEVVKADLDTLDVDDILINGKNWASVVDDGAGGATVTHSVDGVTTTTTLDTDGTSAAYHMALQINSASHDHGVEASARTVLEGEIAGGVTDGGLTIAVGATTHTIRATTSMDDLVAAVNAIGLVASKNEAGGIRMEDTLGRTITIGGTNAIEQTGIADVTQEGFLTLKSIDGTGFTIAAGPDANDDTDETVLGQAGLMAGSYGGDDGQTYSITGGHVVTGTAITAASNFTINGVQVGPTDVNVAAANVGAAELAASVNAVSALTGVTAQANNTIFIQIDAHTTDGASNYDGIDSLTINGSAVTPGANATFSAIATAINNAMIADGSDIRATVANANNGTIQLTSASGSNIILTESGATDRVIDVFREDGDAANAAGADDAVDNNGATFSGRLTFTSTTGPIIFGSNDNATSVHHNTASGVADVFGVQVTGDIRNSASGGSGLNVATAAAAASSLTSLDAAIEKVATMRSGLGALQNRLDHTIANLETAVENHSRSRSLIQDTDYATESAALARAQVLAQAGTAMLSQANAAPQLALQLLQ